MSAPLEDPADYDSGIDQSDTSPSTHSLTSSILNYQYENGRRYHAFHEGQYFMPNDDREQEGMDLMHHISQMILGGELYRAPIESPLDILDIGTGTGIWAIDVGDKFPAAKVIGIDLSAIQPRWVPPNVHFEVDDCETEWTFTHKFDYIHLRNLSGAIADWPELLTRCFEHLRPGGWIECANIEAWGQSANNSLAPSQASVKWQTNLKAAAAIAGRELNIGPDLKRLVSEAGFQIVSDDQYQIPMSPWMRGRRNRELAFFFQHLVFEEIEALSLRLYTKVLGWSYEQLQALLVDVRKDIKNPSYQMFSTMHYVTGQKV